MKTKNSTRRSIGIFTKGLVHGFGQKLVIFPDFYFNENRPETCVYDILEGRSAFLDYKKRSSKSRKIVIFQRG